MIPKKIHYCWFGRGEKPKLAQKCIASWHKYCPDYEIIEWNEDNFDLDANPYTRWCYDNRKYAFLSDYARLLIIGDYGGFYFDTDVELVKSLDPLRHHAAVFGFENDEFVNTGEGFGAEPGNPVVLAMLNEYTPLLDGTHGVIGCPRLNTQTLLRLGLVANGNYQEVSGAVIYPADYFNPYDDPTGKLIKTVNTYSIHWYGKSWMNKSAVLRSKLTRPLHRFFGTSLFRRGK